MRETVVVEQIALAREREVEVARDADHLKTKGKEDT